MSEPQRLYVIASSMSGPCKIGIANDVRRRCAELQTGHAAELQIHWVSGCPEGAKEESLMHKMLAHRRLKGEWFQVTVAEAIDAHAKLYHWGADALDAEIERFASRVADLGLLLEKLEPRFPELGLDGLLEVIRSAALFGYGRTDFQRYFETWQTREEVSSATPDDP